MTILEHLHAIGKVSKLDQWVPHELSERNRQRRAEAAATLLSYQSTTAWLDTIVTGNEKWCCYVNVKRRRSWIDVGSQPQRQPKSGLHSLKVMLSVWWDSEGVILYELLPKNTTITADVYCAQLDRLAAQIERQRPGHGHIRFLHDNARPHVAKSTRQKLLDLGREVLPHPPYSPDMAPSDFHLFLSLSNAICSKTFEDEDELNCWLAEFFTSKPTLFYRDGIHKLPMRWKKVVDNDGDYFN